MPATTFFLVFLALYLPHEALVRRSEILYGKTPLLRTPLSDNMKLEWFFDVLKTEKEFAMYFSGSSVCEYALNPELLKGSVPATIKPRSSYNLGFSGTSTLGGLEILKSLNIHPRYLIVSVAPFDFTQTAVERGEKILKHSRELVAQGRLSVQPAASDPRVYLANQTQHAVQEIFRSTTPERRRTLDEWNSFARWYAANGQGIDDALRFINNSQVLNETEIWQGRRYSMDFFDHGYLALRMKTYYSQDEMDREPLQSEEAFFRTKVAPEFLRDHPKYVARFIDVIRSFHESGTQVVLVRIPVYWKLKKVEEELTSFEKLAKDLSRKTNSAYVSMDIVGDEFLRDPRNFRDPSHLHAESSMAYSTKLAAQLMRLFQ